MRKIFKMLSVGFLTLSLAACSCKKEEVLTSTLENSTDVYQGQKVSSMLTTQQIYEYIRENAGETTTKAFLKNIMEQILDIKKNENNKLTYEIKVKNHFEDMYLNSESYKVNGVFDEDLLASTLESKLYVIDRENLPTSGVTVDLGLKYDYSDYISKAVDYNVYLEMLKGKYILEERPTLLDDSKTRIISIYSSDDLEETEELVEELFDGKYSNLEQLAESKREAEREEIGRQYCVNLGYENEYYEGTCSASTSSSTYDSALYKFTVCENGVRCAPIDGLKYQIKLINEKEYIEEKIVNKNVTDILYPEALSQLFRTNVEDYLHEVIDGVDPFLADWLYNYNKEFSHRDIILTTGPNSTNYLVTARIVDSNSTSVEDKEKALTLLLDKVSDTTVVSHYLDKADVEVTDPVLKEYINSLLGI